MNTLTKNSLNVFILYLLVNQIHNFNDLRSAEGKLSTEN